MIHATFVMEQHLGHGTFYQNLRRFLPPSEQLNAKWVEVTYMHSGGFWEDWKFLPEHLRGMLSGRQQVRSGLASKSDVAFFNTQVPAALASNLLRNQRYVLCTDITPIQYDGMAAQYGHTPDKNGLIASYKHSINTRIFQRALQILPWSNWVGNSLVNDYGVSSDRIQVVPPGVDMQLWQPRDKEQNHSGRRVRLLFVGGDLNRKGGHLLIDAFRKLPPDKSELILVTRTPISEEPGITVRNDLAANSPELIELYQTSDIFVFPTQAEAFGIAAVEASAAGLPVVATKVGGLEDIVLHGNTGFLSEPNDSDCLISSLQLLVDNADLRGRMGMAARHHAELHFDARKNASRIVNVLQGAVKS